LISITLQGTNWLRYSACRHSTIIVIDRSGIFDRSGMVRPTIIGVPRHQRVEQAIQGVVSRSCLTDTLSQRAAKTAHAAA
jgi:hypothetical protein